MWLLEPDTFRRLQSQVSANYPTPKEQAEYAANYTAQTVMVDGRVATISVQGILTDKPDFFAQIFGIGNTTYQDIRAALGVAGADRSIKSIVLAIDSPGGQASAEWLATMDAIAQMEKPVTAQINGLGTSAAYGLASQADTIQAANKMTRVGSIGVAARLLRNDREINVTSTNAPNKMPDARTPEGMGAIRKELDDMHAIFVDAIAQGRGITPDKVNQDYGKGAVLLAQEAQERGMIDTIAQGRDRRKSKYEDKKAMTLDELKAEHPDAYRAAVAFGVEQERDRVCAHLIMGEQSGAVDVAISAVQDGSQMTATLNAKYMSAALNKRDIDARDDDNVPAVVTGEDDNGVPPLGAQVADLVEQQLGMQEA